VPRRKAAETGRDLNLAPTQPPLLDFVVILAQGPQPCRAAFTSAARFRFTASHQANFQESVAMAKPATVKIRLVSTADTGFFYVTKKNPRNTTEKMVFNKYDPVVRKHVEFKEAKIK